MKKLSLVMLFLIIPFFAYSALTVTGEVIDEETDEHLVGVNIFIPGSNVGCATAEDGTYILEVPSEILEGEENYLVAQFIGYETDTSRITQTSGNTTIDFSLTSKAIEAQEVVAVGYGTQRKGELTGSQTSVSEENFSQGNLKDVGEMIQGEVPGLTITNPSGDPREGTQILIRGGHTSLRGGSEPLYIIDGVPGDIDEVSPQNIESVNVLKDASAAAIYGTRGTNGVVIIETSNAQPGRTQVEYSGKVSFQRWNERAGFLTAEQHRSILEDPNRSEFLKNSLMPDRGTSTDWLDEISRTPLNQTHELSITGGSESTSMIANLKYREDKGKLINTDRETFRGRFKVNGSMFNDKVNPHASILCMTRRSDGGFDENYAYRQAMIHNPTDSVYKPDGSYQYRPSIYIYDNPVMLMKEGKGENKHREIKLQGGLNVGPFYGLEAEINYSRKYTFDYNGSYETFEHISNVRDGEGAPADIWSGISLDNYFDMTLNYSRTIGSHNFELLGGYSYEDSEWANHSLSNRFFPTDYFQWHNMGKGKALGKGNASMNSYKAMTKLIAFFGRANYNFQQKYLFSASLRREGSSKFGSDQKWGLFPSVQLGWRISDEKFMNVSWIDDLKLRAGYGVTGTEPQSPYQSLTLLGYNSGNQMYSQGEFVQTIEPQSNPNPNLKWETNKEYNVGIDYTLLNNRISGAIDAYTRTTSDLIWEYSVPVPPNLYPTTLANVAEIQNQGIEAMLEYVAIDRASMRWAIQATFSYNRNEIKALSGDQYELENDWFLEGYTGVPVQQATHRVEVGEPIGNFFGYKSVGVTEEGKWIIETPEGEEISYKNATFEDKQVLGNGLPKYNININSRFKYKNFDLSVKTKGAFDYQILNKQRMFYENPTTNYNMLESATDKAYGTAVLTEPQSYTSYYIEDGDYFKITNLTLGYTMDIDYPNIESVRYYITGENIATFTGYSGIDPEVNRMGLAPGQDERDKFPSVRTFTIGLDLNI